MSLLYPIFRKSSYIPHTMKLVKTVELLEPRVHTDRFLYRCRDLATIFRKFSIIKPLDKLAKLRHDWNELEGRSGIERPNAITGVISISGHMKS